MKLSFQLSWLFFCINEAFIPMAASSGSSRDCKATALITELARCSGALTKPQEHRITQCCEVSKEVMASKARKMVAGANGMPLLTTKSADGTPVSVRVRYTFQAGRGAPVRRSGKETCEALVKNQFIRRLDAVTGQASTCVLLQEPIALQYGKTGPAIFKACMKDWQSLRQMKHDGIAIEHFCFDRCGIQGHERHLRQWYQLHQSDWDSLSDAGVASVDELRAGEWVVVTPCAAHDAQSAFRWGMKEALDDKDLTRDTYIIIESLRNSYALLKGYAMDWVESRICFVPVMQMDEIAMRRDVWQALDVEMETVEVLSEHLQLRFEGGQLLIREGCQALPHFELLDIIETALFAVFKFKKWSESRWLTAGGAARTMIASMLCGLEDLIAYIREHEKNRKWYINGFARLKGDRKVFFAKCALISKVTDGFLAEVIEDNRVALHAERLWGTLAEDLHVLVMTPDHMWATVASIAGTTTEELRSACIAGGHITYGFVQRRVLGPAHELPWTLVRGDIEANLAELRSEPQPQEPVSKNIWKLLRMGYSTKKLVHAMKLLADCPWTTVPAEQQHASISSLKRHHPDYSWGMLACRSLLLQNNRLLHSASEREKRLDKITKRLQALCRKQPQNITGRQQLVADLFSHLRSNGWTHSTREVPRDMHKVIFRQHNSLWLRTRVADKEKLERAARQRACDQHEAIAVEAAKIREEQDALIEKIEADEGESRPILMSQCFFNSEDLELFNKLLAGKEFAPARIEALHQFALECPLPTQGAEARNLYEQQVWRRPPDNCPEWAKPIVDSREAFNEGVIARATESGHLIEYWKFVYGVITPRYGCFCKIELDREYVAPLGGAFGSGGRWQKFHCNFADLHSAEEMCMGPAHLLHFLPLVEHWQGTDMFTQCETIPLGTYLDWMPEKEKAAADEDDDDEAPPPKKTKKSEVRKRDEDIQEFPWLAEMPHPDDFEESKAGAELDVAAKKKKASAQERGESDEEDEDEDEEIGEFMKHLDSIRVTLAGEAPEEGDGDFRVKALSGKWTEEHEGRTHSAIQGRARGGLAEDFCIRRALQRSMRFDIDVYTLPVCTKLARAYCHKLQWLLDWEIAHVDGSRAKWRDSIMDEYEEPAAFKDLADDPDCPSHIADRVRKIRRLMPAS